MKVFGFAGFSGSGKTTLIEQLIPRFVMEGLTVSVVKHAHHGFDFDRPGKDSWRHREAGATEVMLTSNNRWILMHELRGAPEPELQAQIQRMTPVDLLLVEGFKRQPIPKLEVWREATGRPLMFPDDPNIVAVASDTPLRTVLPQLDINDADAVAAFILEYVGLRPGAGLAGESAAC